MPLSELFGSNILLSRLRRSFPAFWAHYSIKLQFRVEMRQSTRPEQNAAENKGWFVVRERRLWPSVELL